MSSHANRQERNLTEERQIKAEMHWNKAKASLKHWVSLWLLLAGLIAFAMVYCAGFVNGRS